MKHVISYRYVPKWPQFGTQTPTTATDIIVGLTPSDAVLSLKRALHETHGVQELAHFEITFIHSDEPSGS